MYIKSIIDMDVQIADVSKKEKDSKKKMNAANAKGLNGMKQKIKKQLREFETAVDKYKQVGVARVACSKVAREGELIGVSMSMV